MGWMIDLRKLLGLLFAYFVALCLCFILGSCKSSKVIDKENNIDIKVETIDSVKIDSNYTSTSIKTIDEKVDINIDVITEIYSAPDSIGRQYVISKTIKTIKGSKSCAESEKDTISVNYSSEEIKHDTGQIKQENKEHIEKEIKTSNGSIYGWLLLTGIIMFFIIYIRDKV